ncbi:MAG TPA: hypothetical protein VNN19_00970 [bacterium]|nr:hypothetical protein [bacterium]
MRAGPPLAVLLLAAAPAVVGFAEPVTVAETSVAAPPAIVAAGGLIHLLWLDRPPGSPPATGELWHAALGPNGRRAIRPQRLAVGADTRFAWPVVARTGARVHVAWMERTAQGLRPRVTVLEETGSGVRHVAPDAPAAEEGGRLAILASASPRGASSHVVWSVFQAGGRAIWYARLAEDGRIVVPAQRLTAGEAPALAPGDPPRLLWWSPAGGGTYVLRIATLRVDGASASLADEDVVTGALLLASPLPAIPAGSDNTLEILVPTLERSFRTAGQLYLVRMRGSAVSARLPVSRGRSFGDISAWTDSGEPLVVWSEPAGRRRSGEIFAAPLEPSGSLGVPVRVSYTPSGSLRPALTGPEVFAAWLETVDVTRFRLVAAPASSRPRGMLLGAPELDPDHPAQAALFAGAVLLSILPFAGLLASLYAVAAGGLLVLAGALLAGSRWWDPTGIGRVPRLGAFFGTVLLLQLAGRSWLPGSPGPLLLALGLAGPAALAMAAIRHHPGGVAALVAVCGALVLQMIVVLFPWGVAALSQL